MTSAIDLRPAPPRSGAVTTGRRAVRGLPPTPAERAPWLRTQRAAALRLIAHDLRRLAGDLDLLEQADDVPDRLAALVGAAMAAVGRPAPPLGPAPIVGAVCAAFRVTHEEIVSRRRGQHVVLARQVAVYLLREITDYSFPRIGDYFGRDHSTAIYSHAQIARRVATEAPFRALLRKVKETLAVRTGAEVADGLALPCGATAPREEFPAMELCR